MAYKKHGLTIGLERIDHEFFVSIKAVGTLTHHDYEMITPLLDAALVKVNTPKVDVFFDVSELEGWDLRAAWDDFKLGLQHGADFNKVALYGHQEWQALAAKVGSWFISGEIRYFDDHDEAIRWLQD